jgi:hypothetical protein
MKSTEQIEERIKAMKQQQTMYDPLVNPRDFELYAFRIYELEWVLRTSGY